MCGIVGYIGEKPTKNFIINGLPKVGILKDSGKTISENDLPKSISGSDIIYVSTSNSATVD